MPSTCDVSEFMQPDTSRSPIVGWLHLALSTYCNHNYCDDSCVHATAPCSACALDQASDWPTVSCIQDWVALSMSGPVGAQIFSPICSPARTLLVKTEYFIVRVHKNKSANPISKMKVVETIWICTLLLLFIVRMVRHIWMHLHTVCHTPPFGGELRLPKQC